MNVIPDICYCVAEQTVYRSRSISFAILFTSNHMATFVYFSRTNLRKLKKIY